MRRCLIASVGIALERQLMSLVLITFAATLAVAPAAAQDILATGSMPAPGTGNPPRPGWNDGTWTGGQWGNGQPPNSSSTYSTGPYSINSGADPNQFTFNGQSLRIASGGELFINNQSGLTTTGNLILDGGTVRAYESSGFNPSSTQFTYGGNIQVAADSTVDLSALQRGSRLSFDNGTMTGSGVFRVNASDAGGGGPSSKVTFNPNNFTMTNFTGSFAVDAGNLEVSESILPNGADIDIAAGATFTFPIGQGGGQTQIGTIRGTGTFAFGASQFRIGAGNESGTFNGTLTGTGGVSSGILVKVGTGTWTFNGNGAALAFASVQAGTLALGTNASLPPNLEIQSGATFAAGTQVSEATIASALQNNWTIYSGAYFGLDTSLGNRTYVSVIADAPDPATQGQTLGTLNFSKIGDNTLILTAANTYTGSTDVQGGAMVIGQTASLPGYNQAGAFAVQPGAALGVVTALSDQVVADLLATGNFLPNSSIAFDTTNGDRNYGVNVINAASGSGALGVTKTGTGTLELSGTNTYTGVTGVWAGTLYVDSVVSLPGYNVANKVDVFTGAKLVIGSGFTNTNMADLLSNALFREDATLGIDTTDADRTYSGNIADSAAGGLVIEKVGTGTLALSGTNSYTGGTTIAAGTLAIASEASLPGYATNGAYSIATGARLTLGSGVSNSAVDGILAADNFGASSTLGFDTTGGPRSYSGNIANMSAGTLAVTKVGDGLLSLSGTNSYTGGTTIAGGTLSIASTASLPGFSTASAYSVGSGASLAIGNTITDQQLTDILATGNFQSGAGVGFDTTGGNRTYTGTIADTGSGPLAVTKVGTGVLTLSGTNSYGGGTTVGAGTLLIASTASLPGFDQAGDFTVEAGATLGVTNAVLDGDIADMLATGNFDTGSALGFDTTSGDRSYTAAVTDPSGVSLGLVKLGTNTLTLSGTNGYTGGTTISAGTIEIASAAALPGSSTNGSFSVASGARLTVADGVTNQEVAGILGTNNFQAGSEFGFDTTAGDRTYTAAIADPAGAAIEVVKEGTGTLSLTGTNTYSGGTTVASGTLAIDSTASLPNFNTNGAYSVANGATLSVGNSVTDAAIADIVGTTNLAAGANLGFDTGANDRTYTAAITDTAQGALGLVKDGTGTLTLSGTNTYTGGTNVTAGTIAIASAASLPGYNTNGDYSVANGATLAVSNSVTDQEVAAILGTTNLAAGASIGFDTGANDRAYTAAIADTAQGALGLVKDGTGTLTLSGSNTYSGGTTVSAGTVTIASTGSLPGYDQAGDYSVETGATLMVANAVGDLAVADMLLTGNFQAGSNLGFDTTSGDRTYSSTIGNTAAGALGLVKDGPGTLTLSGTNTYTGGTTVTEGAIAIASAASLPGYDTDGAYSVASGSTLAVGNSVTPTEIADMLGTTNFQAGSAIGFDTATGDRTYSAALADTAQGSLGLVKTGADALTLSGTNTYTGPTTVEDGELLVTGSTAASSAVSVVGGLLGGSGSVGGTVAVGGAGTLSPGDASAPIAAFSAGATSLASGSTFGFEVDSTAPITPATAADLMVVNGNLSIASGSILDFTDIASSVNPFPDQTTFALINYAGSWDGGLFSFGGSSLADGARFFVGGQEWQIDYDSATGGSNFTGDYVSPGSFVTVTAITAVPEPATLGLVLVAAAGCGALLRRRAARRS
jgi:fibronectin-binding autotransporter adhesin